MGTSTITGTDSGYSRVDGLTAINILNGSFTKEKVDVATVGKRTNETWCWCGEGQGKKKREID